MKCRIGLLLLVCCLLSCTSLNRNDFVAREPSGAAVSKQKPRIVMQSPFSTSSLLSGLKVLPGVESSEPAPTAPLPSLLTKVPNMLEINACTTSICGPAERNWSAFDVLSRPGLVLRTQNFWRDEFEQTFTKLITEKANKKSQMDQRARDLIAKGVRPDSKNPFKIFVIISKYSKQFTQYYSESALKNSGRIKSSLDEAIFSGVFSSLGADEQTAVRLALEKILLPIIVGDPTASFENPLLARLRAKYPSQDLVSAQKYDAQLLKSQLKKVGQVMSPLWVSAMDDQATLDLLSVAAAGGDLNLAESKRYVEFAKNLHVLTNLYFDQEFVDALEKVPVDFESPLREIAAIDGSKIYSEVNAALPTLIQKQSAACKKRLALTMDLNASELKVRKFKTIIGEVKSAAKLVMVRYLDGSDLNAAQSKIDKIEFQFPETNETRIQSLRFAFRRVQEDLKRSDNALNDKSADADQLVLFNALSRQLDSTAKRVEDLEKNEVSELCNALPVETVSDSAHSSLGKINVSWYSANYPEAGVSIVAHEVGHVMSAFLRFETTSPTFLKSLGCTAHRNPYVVTPIVFTPFSNSDWSEEDWADHFSDFVVLELKKMQSPAYSEQNMGCALVLDWGPIYGDMTLAPAPKDPHSSGILRLLMIANDRGGLTPECKPLLNYSVEANRPLDCP